MSSLASAMQLDHDGVILVHRHSNKALRKGLREEDGHLVLEEDTVPIQRCAGTHVLLGNHPGRAERQNKTSNPREHRLPQCHLVDQPCSPRFGGHSIIHHEDTSFAHLKPARNAADITDQRQTTTATSRLPHGAASSDSKHLSTLRGCQQAVKGTIQPSVQTSLSQRHHEGCCFLQNLGQLSFVQDVSSEGVRENVQGEGRRLEGED